MSSLAAVAPGASADKIGDDIVSRRVNIEKMACSSEKSENIISEAGNVYNHSPPVIKIDGRRAGAMAASHLCRGRGSISPEEASGQKWRRIEAGVGPAAAL